VQKVTEQEESEQPSDAAVNMPSSSKSSGGRNKRSAPRSRSVSSVGGGVGGVGMGGGQVEQGALKRSRMVSMAAKSSNTTVPTDVDSVHKHSEPTQHAPARPPAPHARAPAQARRAPLAGSAALDGEVREPRRGAFFAQTTAASDREEAEADEEVGNDEMEEGGGEESEDNCTMTRAGRGRGDASDTTMGRGVSDAAMEKVVKELVLQRLGVGHLTERVRLEVYIYTCTYIYMCACVYIHIYMYIYICIHIHRERDIYVYKYVCILI